MIGTIITDDQWPEGAVIHTWDSGGIGNWHKPLYGHWHLWESGIPIPGGHDWRVPVMRTIERSPAVDLEKLRMLAQGSVDALTQKKVYPADVSEAISSMRHLLALIDVQANVRSSSEHI